MPKPHPKSTEDFVRVQQEGDAWILYVEGVLRVKIDSSDSETLIRFKAAEIQLAIEIYARQEGEAAQTMIGNLRDLVLALGHFTHEGKCVGCVRGERVVDNVGHWNDSESRVSPCMKPYEELLTKALSLAAMEETDG